MICLLSLSSPSKRWNYLWPAVSLRMYHRIQWNSTTHHQQSSTSPHPYASTSSLGKCQKCDLSWCIWKGQIESIDPDPSLVMWQVYSWSSDFLSSALCHIKDRINCLKEYLKGNLSKGFIFLLANVPIFFLSRRLALCTLSIIIDSWSQLTLGITTFFPSFLSLGCAADDAYFTKLDHFQMKEDHEYVTVFKYMVTAFRLVNTPSFQSSFPLYFG